jgi:uncharacterized membrane protein
MNLIILALNHFLHLLATIIWIGGIIMILLVILPSAKASLASTPMLNGFMKEFTKRFTPMANLSIFVLIVTGVFITLYDKNYVGFFDFSNSWSLVVFLKHLVVVLMVIIHFYRGLILIPKIGRLSSQAYESRIANLRKFSLNLIKINLALGVVVLIVSGILFSI